MYKKEEVLHFSIVQQKKTTWLSPVFAKPED